MSEFGRQLADLVMMPQSPEPETLPALPPGTPEMKPYDPTIRERMSSGLQSGLERLGMDRYKARQISQSLAGGQSSALPLSMGLADIVPGLGTALQTQEAVRGGEAAMQSAKEGDYIGAGVEAAFAGLGLLPGAAATGKVIKQSRKLAAPAAPQGVTYATTQEGPFYRVRPSGPEATTRQGRGTKESAGPAPGLGGRARGNVPQPITDEAVQQVIKQPDNFVRRVADEYSLTNAGSPYELPQIPESSLLKQAPIGRVFGMAASDDPRYKQVVFNSYANQFPQLVEQSGAQNYDQLLEAAYRQLAKETEQQFRKLPINMSYHRAGEGNYENSKELLRDIYGNRHMYVYQGGDPHDFLNKVDPSTGLNTNEMFRAVHDFFGHAIHGNTFGPKGEEIAWAAHSKMFSPLARLAMTAETRGQNSFVNYTPINAELKAEINRLNGEAWEASRRGNTELLNDINKDLKEAWSSFQFAPQKSVLLPPEFLQVDYAGGMPRAIQPLVRPQAGTTTSAQLTHFSTDPNLQMTDPARFGTGIKGEEMARLQGEPGAVMERSYFYAGDPSSVRPEPGLGPYRYGTQSSELYDVAADPLLLGTLARESQRIPYTAQANKGMLAGNPFTDIERLVKEYGYEGLVNPNLTQPTAIMFKPKEVRPFKKGGKVTFTDNIDAMRLQLAKGGALKEAAKSKIREAVAAPAKKQGLGEKAADAALRGEKMTARDKAMVAARDASKRGFQQPSKEKDVWYHATHDDFKEFRPSHRGAHFFTKDPEFANEFLGIYDEGYEMKPGANIMPVYLQTQNPFDYENPEHIQSVLENYRIPQGISPEKVRDNLEVGNWNFIEDRNVQRAIKESGFDSFYVNEYGKKNLGVFEPTQIKSAVGMQGSYDVTNPDITKAAGGAVSPDPMRDDLKAILGLKVGGSVKERAKEKLKQAFTPKQVEKTAEKMADKIKKDNPKLTDEQVMAKAKKDAEKKLQWEKVDKPALEKTYGPLEKAPFSASLAERKKNVPEVVEKRIEETKRFLAQPTEPWTPPRKELQAFDRALIKDAMEGFPGVEQTRFPRYTPPRSDLSYIEEIYGDPVNRSLIEGQIKRGLPLGGETFYASLYPVKVAALERGIPEEKFNQFVYSIAPASARNSIFNEMAVGQFLRDMQARGLPLDEKTVTQEMAKFKEKYGTGLPLMPVHREGVKNVLEGGQDLREMLKADIPTNYKIPTYGTQKAGDFGQSMVLDVHEAAGQTRGSRYHPYFTEQGGFGPTEYGAAESQMLDIAQGLGLPGGTAQAGRWFGGGELTGLKSPRGDALDLLERQAAFTLSQSGINPTPRNIRNTVLDMIETGEGILLPYFKKEAMPDLRVEKKKGGAVKKRKVKISNSSDAHMLAFLKSKG